MDNEAPNPPEEKIVVPPEDTESSDVQIQTTPVGPARGHHLRRFKDWYKTHKKWSIPATVLLIVIILGAVPVTRYDIAGLFLKKDFTVQVTDSTAHNPVSGASVSLGGVSALTNGSGKATLHGIKVGKHKISISKKYYQDQTAGETVPILSQKTVPDIALAATGRQVKIKVSNIITGKSLADVDITAAGTTAKTDFSGTALLVLPASGASQKAMLSLSGYNDSSVTVQVSSSAIKENDLKLTPSGKVYFLSNRSGDIDVMKTNLDGSDAQVAVTGTGSEDASETSVLESADGKYVALVSKRDSSDATPQLYVLATADDKLLQADNGDATFQLYDWVGDTLVYTVQRQDLPVWQAGTGKIKAYDASTGTTTLLDQTAGSDSTANANEYYSEVMVSAGDVIYGKIWQGSDFTTKQNSLQVIGVDGQNHQVLASYAVADNLNFAQHSPDTLYIWVHDSSANTDIYSQYTAGGSLKPANITNDQFYLGQDSYFFSPSRSQTFWSEVRDGKNTLLVGDQSGGGPATIASASDYSAYGWYTDNYLLLSKDSSELYITGVHGGTPLKISDYLSSAAYGYGR